MASQQQVVCPIAVATAPSHHLTYIEIDEAGAIRGTWSPYHKQPSLRDTSLRNSLLRMGD